MNSVSIVVWVIVVAAVCCAGYYAVRRFRKGSACCGPKSEGLKRTGAADRNKANYPYQAEAYITMMTCDKCAAKVENALNAVDGIWAKVSIGSKKAVIRSKTPVDEKALRKTIHQAGYGVGAFRID